MFRSLRTALARIGRWPRLAAAGSCLLLAALSALGSGRPPARPAPADQGVAVVVAARDLPAGHRLVGADLAVVRWPAALRPATARGSRTSFVGATLATPLARREPLTSARVVGPGVLAGLPGATVAAVVAVDHDVGAFVRPGDRVGLLAARRTDAGGDVAGGAGGSSGGDTGGGAASRPGGVDVARHVLVLAVLPGSSADDVSISLVLAVDAALARRIAGMEPGWTFSAVGESP